MQFKSPNSCKQVFMQSTNAVNLSLPFSNPSNSTLIILNQPLPSFSIFSRLWNNCSVRIVADGGANRLFRLLPEAERERFVPDLIIGDLDSLADNVNHFYHKVLET
jgi:thiamine pyrophosphokinase